MNRSGSAFKSASWFMVLLLTAFAAGCGSGGASDGGESPADPTPPTVLSTNPVDLAVDVVINENITATFSEAMDPATITTATFTLMQGATPVPGAVAYAGTTATLFPNSNLAANGVFTATITTGARDLAGNALAVEKTWSFTTGTTAGVVQPTAAGAGTGAGGAGRGPTPIELQTAGDFVILTQAAITNIPTSAVTGNVGLSAAPGADIGLTCAEVTGVIYTVDTAAPPCMEKDTVRLTTAAGHAIAAWIDGTGRAPDYIELWAGSIGGRNLGPATYKWSTSVQIPTNLTLTGGPNDVWIFLIEHDLVVSSGVQILLAGGALPQNVYWLTVIDAVDLGASSQFKGVILGETAIVMGAGASIDGRLLATNSVNLDANSVTQPVP